MLMMTMTFAEMVRVIYIVLLYRRSDVYWMVADLLRILGIRSILGGGRRQPGNWYSPKGKVNRGESQAIRKASDHHPRLQ